jgi:hypothetical protein
MTALQTPPPDAAVASDPCPADVAAFAADLRVDDCLGPLLGATRQLFPAARRLRLRLEDDPEVRGGRHILFEVQPDRLERAELRQRSRRWEQELLARCPPPRACLFCLRLEAPR